jgi:multidrug efflux pump subunit AcrB
MLLAICALLVAGTYLAYNALGSDLLPEMDEGGFILDYIMPAGSSLTETNRVLDHVDRILHSLPEVESTSRRTGLQMDWLPSPKQHRRYYRQAQAKRDRASTRSSPTPAQRSAK